MVCSECGEKRPAEFGIAEGLDDVFKTELCLEYLSCGSCIYGEKCSLAHGEEELRKKPGADGKADGKSAEGKEEAGATQSTMAAPGAQNLLGLLGAFPGLANVP